MVLSGCSDAGETDVPDDGDNLIGGVGIANPMKYYDSAKEVEEVVGIYLNVPEKATDVSYLTISGTIAQADFFLEDREYTLRASNSLTGTALHGVYGEQVSSEERTFENGTKVMLTQMTESYYVAEWEKDGYFFSLSFNEEAGDGFDGFLALSEVVEQITE